jgi:hypothetical protein
MVISRAGTYSGLWGTSHNRNAYFDRWQFDRRGRLHITWTFRETPSYGSNHDICYAYSDDVGLTWKNNDGKPVAVTGENPIDVNTEGIVAVPVTQRRWIINTSGFLVDARGRVHVMARHIPESEPLDSNIRTYHHYWRDTGGTWHGTELTQTGLRPKLAEDFDQNLYLVYSGGGRMGLLYASSASRWTDWQPLTSASVSNIAMGSEAQLDFDRMKDGVLSLFYTEMPEDGVWGDPQPLKVLEWSLGGDEYWAGFPVRNGWVDTKDWMGSLYVAHAPWIWAPALENWIFLPEYRVNDAGAWLFAVPR